MLHACIGCFLYWCTGVGTREDQFLTSTCHMRAWGVSYIGVGARAEPVFTQRNPVGRVNAHCYRSDVWTNIRWDKIYFEKIGYS